MILSFRLLWYCNKAQKMKKAQLKELRRIIATLPNIPLIEGGKAKTTAVHMTGASVIAAGLKHSQDGKPIQAELNYEVNDRTEYVNKEKYFLDRAKQGEPIQKTIDYWNERFKKVTELIANYVEPRLDTPDLRGRETIEERKQRELDEWEKQEARNERLIHKGRRALGFPRHKQANKKKK